MLPTYRACALEHGPGMKSRVHAIMSARMRQGDIFQIIGNSIRTSIHAVLDHTYDNISNYVLEICANLESQIDTSRGAEAGEVSRSHPRELERIRTALTEAKDVALKIQLQTSPAGEEARRLGWIQ